MYFVVIKIKYRTLLHFGVAVLNTKWRWVFFDVIDFAHEGDTGFSLEVLAGFCTSAGVVHVDTGVSPDLAAKQRLLEGDTISVNKQNGKIFLF